MDVFFYLVPSLMIAIALTALIGLMRRARRIHSAWNSGLTAEARCLNTYTTTSGGGGDTSVSTTLHHVYEFTTREGRAVRFEESNGPRTIVTGDIVTVRYVAEHPEQATARPPQPGRLLAEQGCMLAFFGVFIAFCVFFMLAFNLMSDGFDSPFGFGDGDGVDDTTNTVVVDGVTMTP
ncbi:DUF3592 domain-containing protein [Streptomyces sp. TLI_185]|uniref:DUF3592 domain-containing protein n=1 Tax=Streptomyces sp. TLI_185 TaxID=2485151 RepID=UPI000F4E61F1|nr:DUF3592 domain-containing protein [Streptomyces sp. TLI_185]RPF33771.1 hypothetical protein EDD92_3696 [Streptomyces sp. TLI_185]